jgi:hypothetical protein
MALKAKAISRRDLLAACGGNVYRTDNAADRPASRRMSTSEVSNALEKAFGVRQQVDKLHRVR